MPPVDHVGQRLSLASIIKPHPDAALGIDGGHLLARAQIGDCRLRLCSFHPKCHAAAGAAAVETENESRALRRASMHMRIDTERAVIAAQPGELALDIVEARPPHERAVAEDPEIVGSFAWLYDRAHCP